MWSSLMYEKTYNASLISYTNVENETLVKTIIIDTFVIQIASRGRAVVDQRKPFELFVSNWNNFPCQGAFQLFKTAAFPDIGETLYEMV